MHCLGLVARSLLASGLAPYLPYHQISRLCNHPTSQKLTCCTIPIAVFLHCPVTSTLPSHGPLAPSKPLLPIPHSPHPSLAGPARPKLSPAGGLGRGWPSSQSGRVGLQRQSSGALTVQCPCHSKPYFLLFLVSYHGSVFPFVLHLSASPTPQGGGYTPLT
jgi:hypothetical protein